MGEYILKELDHLLGFVDRLGCMFIIIQINCLEIQGLFKDFCHKTRTVQDKQSNSRAFPDYMNPVPQERSIA